VAHPHFIPLTGISARGNRRGGSQGTVARVPTHEKKENQLGRSSETRKGTFYVLPEKQRVRERKRAGKIGKHNAGVCAGLQSGRKGGKGIFRAEKSEIT